MAKIQFPRLTPRDMARIQHAIELLDAANASVMGTSVSNKQAVSRLLYEAEQEIMAVGAKVARYMERHGLVSTAEPEPPADANGTAGTV